MIHCALKDRKLISGQHESGKTRWIRLPPLPMVLNTSTYGLQLPSRSHRVNLLLTVFNMLWSWQLLGNLWSLPNHTHIPPPSPLLILGVHSHIGSIGHDRYWCPGQSHSGPLLHAGLDYLLDFHEHAKVVPN